MPEPLHSRMVRTSAPAATTPSLPVSHCWPHCSEPRTLSDTTFAIRMGWLKLRRTLPPGSGDQRAPSIRRYQPGIGTFARLGVSAALVLALFGPSSGGVSASYGPIGAAFRVNTTIVGDQEYPAIAADAQGNYVAVWQGPDGSMFIHDIYAQRYRSNGVPLGAELRVNTFTTGDQQAPAVAMDAAGAFVIAWQSFAQDGDSDGIFAQRYDASGVPRGVEFPVNSYTTSFQFAPAVAIDAAGAFVIAWQSFAQDGDSNGIYAQRYTADGQLNGAELPVNTFTTGSQENPAVAMDASGDL